MIHHDTMQMFDVKTNIEDLDIEMSMMNDFLRIQHCSIGNVLSQESNAHDIITD